MNVQIRAYALGLFLGTESTNKQHKQDGREEGGLNA